MKGHEPPPNEYVPQSGEQPSLDHGREVFRSASRRLHVRWADRYDVDVPVRLGTGGYSHFEEALQRHGREQGAVIVGFTASADEIPGLVVVEGALLHRMAGVLLGEPADADPPPYRARPPSQVEFRIARRLAGDVLACIEESCFADPPPQFRLVHTSSGSGATVALPGSSSVVEMSLDVGPPERPYGLLTVVLALRMSRLLWASEVVSARTRTSSADVVQRVRTVRLPVVAELARLATTLTQLRALAVGDVLELGSPREVSLRVGGETALAGEAGQRDGVRCVRLTRRVGTVDEPR